MSNTLFENYEQFISEHSDELATPSGALRMITDNGMFRAYADSLTEGFGDTSRSVAMRILNRQREMVLTESANVPSSGLSFGWTVNL